LYERTTFYFPLPSAVPEFERRPGPVVHPLAGESPFRQGPPRIWAPVKEDFSGPGGADAWLSLLLDRARRVSERRQQAGGPYSVGRDGSSITQIPQNGIPYYEVNGIATPAAGAAETVVVSFAIPPGTRGVITGLLNLYTGPGFIDTSGNLIWRIRIGAANVNGAPARNFGQITWTNGNLTSGPVGIQGISDGVYSGAIVEFTITHVAGSPLPPGPGTRIVCGLKGYYWPVSSV